MLLVAIPLAIIAVFLRARHFQPSGIAPLTSLRALAAAMVFFLHYSEQYRADHTHELLSVFLRGGYEGVSVFFVLSGFLLTLSIRKELAAHTFNIRRYTLRRAARIYPLYYALLAMTAVLAPQMIHWQNIVLVQGYFPSVVFSGIPPAWTLTVEETFYLLLPLVIWLCAKVGKSNGIVLSCLTLIGLGFGLLALHVPDFLGTPLFLWSHTIFGRFPIFAIGIACAFFYEQRKHWPRALLGVSAVMFVAATCWSAVENERPNFRAADLFVGMAAGGLILGLASDNKLVRLFGNRYFAYLGVVSYALYLVQLTPLIALLMPLVHNLPDVLAVYAVATLFAMACYELIERPARTFILSRACRAFLPWAKTCANARPARLK